MGMLLRNNAKGTCWPVEGEAAFGTCHTTGHAVHAVPTYPQELAAAGKASPGCLAQLDAYARHAASDVRLNPHLAAACGAQLNFTGPCGGAAIMCDFLWSPVGYSAWIRHGYAGRVDDRCTRIVTTLCGTGRCCVKARHNARYRTGTSYSFTQFTGSPRACPGVRTRVQGCKGADAMRCLAEQPGSSLSPSCRTELSYVRQTWTKEPLSVPGLAEACRGDATAHCANEQQGRGLGLCWSVQYTIHAAIYRRESTSLPMEQCFQTVTVIDCGM